MSLASLMKNSSKKIGVFDSGVGGITVLTELRKRFHSSNFVYLGDTANLPYGTKSPAQIEKLSIECARILKTKAIDALVVACNTASSWALTAIREVMSPVPVLGVVEPGVAAAMAALQSAENGAPVLVLATRATVKSEAYGKTLRKLLAEQGKTQVPIFEQACPLLVPIIEEGWVDHPVLHQVVQEYVRPFLTTQGQGRSSAAIASLGATSGTRPGARSGAIPGPTGSRGIALLACTHYPWIHEAFQKALPGWEVVNSAWAVAEVLSKDFGSGNKNDPTGKIEWIFTDAAALPRFARELVV